MVQSVPIRSKFCISCSSAITNCLTFSQLTINAIISYTRPFFYYYKSYASLHVILLMFILIANRFFIDINYNKIIGNSTGQPCSICNKGSNARNAY